MTDDTEDDDGESVLLGFGNTLPARVSAGSVPTATVAIIDDDGTPTGIDLLVSPTSIGEADGETDVTVTATLVGSNTLTTATTVSLSLSGTASDPGDYAVTGALASVTIPAGRSSASGMLTLTPVDDEVVEGEETVVVDGEVTGFTVTSATITLQDDDTATLSISGPASSVSEGSNAVFTVTLSHAVSESVEVAWSAPATGDDAKAGDLSATSGSVTFNSGETQKNFTVGAVDDMLSEDEETFTVTLGTVTSALSDRVSVDTGSASAESTIAESDPITVEISGPATVAEGDSASYTVSLSPSGVTLTADLTVDYATSDGTAIVGSDYTAESETLTFTETSAGEQTVTVDTLQDTLDEAGETFTASLSNARGGGGPAPAVSGAAFSVTTTIIDDDQPPPPPPPPTPTPPPPSVTVTFQMDSYSVAEGDSIQVIVTLSAETERTVRIPLTKTNQSGASRADYSGVPDDVTFTGGDTQQSFTLTAIDDTEYDDGESVLLGFGTLPAGVTLGSTTEATVSMIDDDPTSPAPVSTSPEPDDSGIPLWVFIVIIVLLVLLICVAYLFRRKLRRTIEAWLDFVRTGKSSRTM